MQSILHDAAAGAVRARRRDRASALTAGAKVSIDRALLPFSQAREAAFPPPPLSVTDRTVNVLGDLLAAGRRRPGERGVIEQIQPARGEYPALLTVRHDDGSTAQYTSGEVRLESDRDLPVPGIDGTALPAALLR